MAIHSSHAQLCMSATSPGCTRRKWKRSSRVLGSGIKDLVAIPAKPADTCVLLQTRNTHYHSCGRHDIITETNATFLVQVPVRPSSVMTASTRSAAVSHEPGRYLEGQLPEQLPAAAGALACRRRARRRQERRRCWRRPVPRGPAPMPAPRSCCRSRPAHKHRYYDRILSYLTCRTGPVVLIGSHT
jgi:hypothetical protein